ncbi:MAG TPA: hypothetical protein VJS44_03140 [Pyrinomonadaceae bacterium]|nr:hypothetical protein [Pyrinomonadaceae bacterium]
MAENESSGSSPREYDYWKLDYRQLALMPEWGELDEAERARRLLQRIEEKLRDLDAPPQRKALFACSTEDRLKVARRMLEYFEQEAAGQ